MLSSHVKRLSLQSRLKKDIRKNWIYYLMIIPVVVYFILLSYVPMYGITLAFKDYKVKEGILGSPWVGFEHFARFFSAYNFKTLLMNTLTISLYGLAMFPIPILFALLLNYLKSKRLKKTVQMVSYAPHFLSTVIICSMVTLFTTPDTGAFNLLRGLVGLDSVNFLAKPEWFKTIYTLSGVWQNMGWSAIIYLSTLAGVDYEMHEAAIVDGATIVQRMRYIDIPSIKPTVVMLLIMSMGSLMNVGFEKVFLLQNNLNASASSIISTYVYHVGLVDNDFAFSTAVGLFNNIINIILLVSANYFSKKVLDESMF